MTCYLSKDDWHSYYKKSLDRQKLDEMSSHLTQCPECQNILWQIQETAELLAKGRINFDPPPNLKLNIMKSITRSGYQADSNKEPTQKETASSRHLELRNWGFSMMAAGFLLFAFNLSSLSRNLMTTQVTQLDSGFSKQIILPLTKMNQLAHTLLIKIDALTDNQNKSNQ
ncbi:anti-sigma factor family protein [Desulfosporosinus sp. SYSU MS00001]|uniref:anti-sigma factor family protein n=1 Tax=Desulfosporosinus sp. SYSU MS00001 TaxID=3416284 RepID=UPI003CF67BF5